MKKLLSILMLLVAIVTGAKANQINLIPNVTLPDMPTSSLDMASQTFKTVDGNGWIVFDPYADIATGSGAPTWWTYTSKASQSQDLTQDNLNTLNPTAPFVAKTTTHYKINSSGTYAVAFRFTGANTASFLVNPRSGSNNKEMNIALFKYDSSATPTQTQVGETKKTSANAWHELIFTGLSTTETYVAYVYGGSAGQNGSLAEIALRKPVSSFSVTYRPGEGTGDEVVASSSAVADCPEGFTAPTGKKFNGWNTESDGTGTAYAVGDAVTSALTLYAQWAYFYTVTYNLGGATAGTVPTQADVADGGSFNVAAVPTDLVAPAGKEFKCWNDGTNDVNPGASYTVEGADVTLTAIYQDKTYQGLTPSETLDFSNLGSTFSTIWFDYSGKMDKNFEFDATNGKVTMSPFAIYQSNAQDRNLNLWAITDSGNSSGSTWTATGDFKGSSFYFNEDARAAAVHAGERIHYYRVIGINSVSALFGGKAVMEAYEVNAGVVFPDPAEGKTTSVNSGTATITGLDEAQEYIILVRGNNGSSNVMYQELEFTFSAKSKETVTIPLEGFATYVTSSALDFSSQNGAFKAYVVSGLNTAQTSAQTAEVTQVPAGTALLLKGAKGSYDVDIIASADEVTNLLQASNGGVKGDNSTIFAYSKSNAKFMKVAQDVVIPAGKAYLKITTPNAGDALDIDFGGETAVEAIAEANEAEAAAPVKVIKNGQLFIGNYNVAGQQVK